MTLLNPLRVQVVNGDAEGMTTPEESTALVIRDALDLRLRLVGFGFKSVGAHEIYIIHLKAYHPRRFARIIYSPNLSFLQFSTYNFITNETDTLLVGQSAPKDRGRGAGDARGLMLLYYNKSFFWLLVERRGSVFYRCDSLLGGIVVAGLGVAVQYWLDSDWEVSPTIFHHYGFQALGAGVTFAIVFRTQLAWNRYWEAVTQLHFMYSKWADAFSQFQAFAEVTRKAATDKGDQAKADRILRKQKRLKVNYALLSTVAADRLTQGDNQRMEEVRAKGSELMTYKSANARKHENRQGDVGLERSQDVGKEHFRPHAEQRRRSRVCGLPKAVRATDPAFSAIKRHDLQRDVLDHLGPGGCHEGH
eukprot:s440_g9.t1